MEAQQQPLNTVFPATEVPEMIHQQLAQHGIYHNPNFCRRILVKFGKGEVKFVKQAHVVRSLNELRPHIS